MSPSGAQFRTHRLYCGSVTPHLENREVQVTSMQLGTSRFHNSLYRASLRLEISQASTSKKHRDMATMGRFFVSLLLLLSLSFSMKAHYIPSGSCSVDVVNDMKTPIVVNCWSGDDDLGYVTVRPSCDYHFELDPNIFGTTLFLCKFEWGVRSQQIKVLKGDAYKDQLQCSDDGPCVWKVTTRGFYWSNQTYGDALSWTFYTDWSTP